MNYTKMKNKTTLFVALMIATITLSGCYAGQKTAPCSAYQCVELNETAE